MNTKEQYLRKVEAQIKEWSAEIEELKAKMQKKQVDIEAGIEEGIKEIEDKKSILEDKLKDLQETGEENWEQAKNQVDNFLGDLKSAYISVVHRNTL